MKKSLLFLLFIPFFALSQIPSGYYDSANGLSGYALKSKLSEIISKNYNWHYNDLRNLYFKTDLDHFYDHGPENTTLIVDLYTERPFAKDTIEYSRANLIGNASGEAQGWNREHVMPQSTFYGNYPMYSDLFSVIPADAYINQIRSNYPYARVSPTASNLRKFSNSSKYGKSSTPGYNNTVYEPIDEFKGDIARILLYFIVRYEGKLGTFAYDVATNPLDGNEERGYEDWYITMLKDWNHLDPVSDRERDRNEQVYAIQKNRNPFVDHPEYVNMIWDQTYDMVAPSAPLNLAVNQTSAYFATLSWNASSDADLLGYKIYKDGFYFGFSPTNSFVADHLLPSTVYNFTVKAYDKSYNESASSNSVSFTTLATDIYAKDLMISKYIEGTGTASTVNHNNAIEIVNKTGHDVNLNEYRIAIQLRSANYYYSDAFTLDGKLSNGQTAVIMHPNSSFTCFTPQQARFVTNSPPMTFDGSQYFELSHTSGAVDVVGLKDSSNSNGNKSLYRLSSINQPTTTYNPSEWQVYANDYCQNLGVLANDEVQVVENRIVVYPNPVTQGKLFADGAEVQKIKAAKIFDVSGTLISTEENPFRSKNYLNVDQLQKGLYILVLDDKSFKFIKN